MTLGIGSTGLSSGLTDGIGVGRSGVPAQSFAPVDFFRTGKNGFLYDISDLDTLFQDVAGTTPVTADGQQVQLIMDKSGNGNHASQLAGATYRTDGTLHWLEANGTTNYYDFTRLTFSSVVTALHCTTPDDVINPRMVSGDGILSLEKFGYNASNHFFRLVSTTSNASPAASLTNYVTGYRRLSSYVVNNYVDSISVDSYTESGDHFLSSLFGAFSSGVIGQFFDGKYYGGFAVERALSKAEISIASRYLAKLAGRIL